MKNTTFFFVTLLFTTSGLLAQELSDHTLGLRLGDSDGFGVEISYQKSLSRYNRAELNLGIRNSREFSAFKLTGVYHWVHHIDGGFNWYYGFGGGLGSVNFEPVPGNNGFVDDNDGFFLFAAGNVGAEYDFDIPLLLSLDFRPEIGLIGFRGFDNNFLFDIALGIRYQF